MKSEKYARLYRLLCDYDEALAGGQDTSHVVETMSADDADLANDFGDLRACVELMELARLSQTSVGSLSASASQGVPPAVSGCAADFPHHLGRFELRSEIGRGGCGVVFRAYDPKVDREVALKIPLPEALVTRETRQRFLREGRAAGALDHSGLVPIFEVGKDGPVCFIASAYIRGPSLAKWLRRQEHSVEVRHAARLVVSLAEALEHAHARGVIHRDMKPGNVLLDPHESVGATAELPEYDPKITDFGLA